MCGITGFIGSGSIKNIIEMTNSLYHRGPDDGNIYFNYNIALGHRRLSILDIKFGSQPMIDPKTGAIIVYNGEVYNHLQIRQELVKLGQNFSSQHSDTETVLKAFCQWKTECFIKFNGMFACAIYDPQTNKLYLARDRFGEKPLFYIINHNGFAFASEIRALKLWDGFIEKSNIDNLQRFFAWNYLPGNKTIENNCFSLEPGHWLSFEINKKKVEKKCYWKFYLNPDLTLIDKKENELIEELRRLLIQAVKRRLLSDVPLGIFLSGGIDSSAILAAATKIMDLDKIKTFTIGFNEKSFDESCKAKKVAEYLKVTNHVQFLTQKIMENSIKSILTKLSEPFGDASLIPTYHLAKFARQYVTVALSGDGGDELFGGYDPLKAIFPSEIYRKFIPNFLTHAIRKGINLIPASDKNMSLDFKLKRWLKGLSYFEKIQIPIWMSGLEPNEIKKFFFHPLSAELLYEDSIHLYEEYSKENNLNKALLFFICLYLPYDILVKSDRASMMVSLESRAVFLDNDIVDFCSKLPLRFKYRNGQTKYLLKKALKGWVPDDIINQPKKGFGIPLNLWLRSLKEVNCQVPDLKPNVITYCYMKHKQKKGDFRYFLWDLQSYANLTN